jgi:hypothetical protein
MRVCYLRLLMRLPARHSEDFVFIGVKIAVRA